MSEDAPETYNTRGLDNAKVEAHRKKLMDEQAYWEQRMQNPESIGKNIISLGEDSIPERPSDSRPGASSSNQPGAGAVEADDASIHFVEDTPNTRFEGSSKRQQGESRCAYIRKHHCGKLYVLFMALVIFIAAMGFLVHYLTWEPDN